MKIRQTSVTFFKGSMAIGCGLVLGVSMGCWGTSSSDDPELSQVVDTVTVPAVKKTSPVPNQPTNKKPTPPPSIVAAPAPWDFPKVEPKKVIQSGDFIGSTACGSCHAHAYKQWQRSAHGQAGGRASAKRFIPKIDGRLLKFTDGHVRVEKKNEKLLMVVQFDDRRPLRYEIDSIVGQGLMYGGGAQTFFHRADDGRLLLLPVEYNVQEKAWYCQTETDKKWAIIDGTFSLRECGFPPSRALGSAPNEACQNCHGSQIQVLFDSSTGRFRTGFTALQINCESCHGPGRRHVGIMQNGGASSSGDIGFEPLELGSTRQQVLVCMNCHGNKPDIGLGYLSGHDFDTYFSNLLMAPPLSRKTHFDGRLTDFGYQQGHLFSACYTDGSMTCVDCHGPHGLTYRDIYGVPMKGRFADQQCVDCHPAKIGTNHSRHRVGTDAARCTTCHMPSHQLGAVGQQIPHRRADHAIPIPRPVHDMRLGIKTPCQRCHTQDSPDAVAKKVETLFGEIKPMPTLTSTLFTHSRQLGRTEVPRGAEADRVVLENLVAQFTKRSPLTAVYAMTYLVGELLVGHRPSPSKAAVSGLWRASESEDLDVAGAALTTILFFSDSNSTWRTRIKSILRQHTSREALRRKIAAHLVGIDQAFSAISRPIRERVARRMVHDGLMIDPQKYEMLPALGASFLAQGDAARAQTFFERAAELPLFTKPRHPVGLLGGRQDFLNLVAATQGSRGQLDQAVKTLKTVLSIYPYDGQARARLCQVLEQRSQWREFAHCLREWSEYHPHFLPIYVRRAALLVRLGRQSEALQVITDGLKLAPKNASLQKLKVRTEAISPP